MVKNCNFFRQPVFWRSSPAPRTLSPHPTHLNQIQIPISVDPRISSRTFILSSGMTETDRGHIFRGWGSVECVFIASRRCDRLISTNGGVLSLWRYICQGIFFLLRAKLSALSNRGRLLGRMCRFGFFLIIIIFLCLTRINGWRSRGWHSSLQSVTIIAR